MSGKHLYRKELEPAAASRLGQSITDVENDEYKSDDAGRVGHNDPAERRDGPERRPEKSREAERRRPADCSADAAERAALSKSVVSADSACGLGRQSVPQQKSRPGHVAGQVAQDVAAMIAHQFGKDFANEGSAVSAVRWISVRPAGVAPR
jgi:hypothetical protein